MLTDLTIRQFMESLASHSPIPGGGSAAALAGTSAASLIAMVASLTIGKEGSEDSWEEMRKVREDMEKSRKFFVDAIDADAEAYAKVVDCFKLPKNTEEEKEFRSKAIQRALYQAAVVPLETAEKAFSLFDYAKLVLLKGNKNAASDGAVAALMARAAVKGALYNVKINAVSLKDQKLKGQLITKAEDLDSKADSAETEIQKLLSY